MFYRNDWVLWKGNRRRLIQANIGEKKGWTIDEGDRKAVPQEVPLSELSPFENPPTPSSVPPTIAPASQRLRDAAYARIQPLLEHGTALYNKKRRRVLIAARAIEIGCTTKTLEKDLRRWWQRGQCQNALLPDFANCGKAKGDKVTRHRGRPPRAPYNIYQVTVEDQANFRNIILNVYHQDERVNLTAAHSELIYRHYHYTDGNDVKHRLPPGQRPSLRQFTRWYRTNYSLETRIRARKGSKKYEKDFAPTYGDFLATNLGAGHRYEADGTKFDAEIVACWDRVRRVGKPQLYLIVDQRSRLIVGFYLGLENANWDTVRDAFVCVAQDKEKLCRHYDIPYDPDDWPATGVLPEEVLADKGELQCNNAGDLLVTLQNVSVSNLPAQTPQKKPIVESSIKRLIDLMIVATPGFDPSWNQRERRAHWYGHLACLTLRELTRSVLLAIIAINRSPILDYPLTPEQIGRKVLPSPIGLWNDSIVTRSGLLRRASEDEVRANLMPRGVGVVTEDGIRFEDCYYIADDPRILRAIAESRGRRAPIDVAYDRRLIDTIFLILASGDRIKARLSPKCQEYTGYSLAEYKDLVARKKADRPVHQDLRGDETFTFRQQTDKVHDNAAKELKDAGRISKSERTRFKAEDRIAERRLERQRVAGAAPADESIADPVSSPPELPAPPSPPIIPAEPTSVHHSSRASQLLRSRLSRRTA